MLNKETNWERTKTNQFKPGLMTRSLSEWNYVLASSVQLRHMEEGIAIFTDSVQAKENGFVVHPFAVQIKERGATFDLTVR